MQNRHVKFEMETKQTEELKVKSVANRRKNKLWQKYINQLTGGWQGRRPE